MNAFLFLRNNFQLVPFESKVKLLAGKE